MSYSEQIPHLFHIGTQRAGSSYLFNLFKGHPEIVVSPRQEIHFYNANFERGLEWYLANFPEQSGHKRHRIDTSPKYFMQGKIAAPRIYEMMNEIGKKALFLLILRNPIDYIHSHYQMHLRKGYFHNHPDLYPKVPTELSRFVELYPDYLKRGMYNSLLSDWLDYFDRSQFKILFFEEYIRDPDSSLKSILMFFKIAQKNKKLNPPVSAQNKMWRYPLLYKIQKTFTHNTYLKRLLKKSHLFNYIYKNYLTASPPKLTVNERLWLKERLVEDVEQLKMTLSQITPLWKDFT